MDADYLLHELPLAAGMQYLCAKAIQNGAAPVWMDESDAVTQESTFDRAREIVRMALRRNHDGA